MTREEAIYRLKNMAWLYGSAEREKNIEAIDMAISALSATNDENLQNCGDLISRADAHKAICRLCSDYERCEYSIGKTCYRAREHNAIDKVPSVSAERVGEWIKPTLEYDKRRCDVICPFCHHGFLGRPNYCSHCGAKMKGGAE